MREVKGETRDALMNVLLLVTILATLAFPCFTGQASTRGIVIKLIARKRVSRLTPFGGSVDLNRSPATEDIRRPFRWRAIQPHRERTRV